MSWSSKGSWRVTWCSRSPESTISKIADLLLARWPVVVALTRAGGRLRLLAADPASDEGSSWCST